MRSPAIERADDGGAWLTVRAPDGSSRYLVEKGSVCVDGVSLTVAARDGGHVRRRADPAHAGGDDARRRPRVGDPVNLEVDVIAKYVEALLDGRGA